MCVLSYIGDKWADDFGKKYPQWPTPPQIVPNPYPDATQLFVYTSGISKEEFEKFKEEMRKELAALKDLLLAAKKYDEATGQPDCHMDQKVELIKKIAEMVGVDMNDVFSKKD